MFGDIFEFNNIVVLVKRTRLMNYDFDFRRYFDCTSIQQQTNKHILLRIGAISDFIEVESNLKEMGMKLLFTEYQHNLSSRLECWYPLLCEYTPFSKVYTDFPEIDELLEDFKFPIFVKGNRQTSYHKKNLCIIKDKNMYENLKKEWKKNKILHWQQIAIRKFIDLEKVDDTSFPDMIQFSYEFRVFIWKGKIVGIGKYWCMGKDYYLKDNDKEEVTKLALKAYKRINVPFLAVDVAKTKSGQWIIVEINDGQECGYAGVEPYLLWKNVSDAELNRTIT